MTPLAWLATALGCALVGALGMGWLLARLVGAALLGSLEL